MANQEKVHKQDRNGSQIQQVQETNSNDSSPSLHKYLERVYISTVPVMSVTKARLSGIMQVHFRPSAVYSTVHRMFLL